MPHPWGGGLRAFERTCDLPPCQGRVLELRVAVSTKFEEKREEDTSSTKLHTDETAQQSSYASQQGSSSSNWGWNWWNWGYSASSSSQSSQSASSSSFKAKNIEMATVDAKYASTYNYAVEASSVVKTKIVPVPPPAVFAEIVRAKVQERRDWERRLRLTEEARTIFLGQVGAADAMAGKLGNISTAMTSENKEKAVALQEADTQLQESHSSLTNEHWALTRSVADRAAADERMRAILARTAEIRTFFSEGGDADALKEALRAELAGYKALVDSLQKKLAATGSTTPQ